MILRSIEVKQYENEVSINYFINRSDVVRDGRGAAVLYKG